MNSPCRGDCNQGRNCYCGSGVDDRLMLESVGLLAYAFVAVCVIVIAVAAMVMA